MTSQQAPREPKSNARLWIAVVTTIGGAIAVVPPMITAFRSNPGITQSGTDNTAIVGSTVNSNNQTNNTYLSMWVEGARTIVGAPSKRVVAAPPLQQPQPTAPPSQAIVNPALAAQAPTQTSQEPEPGAIGRIVVNASLLNDATWSPEPSRVNRLLTFYFHAEATGAEDKAGNMDTTLAREGKDICTISLNTRTSPISSGVRWGDSTCYDTLPANAAATYRARVKATEMGPVVVRLDRVDTVRK